VTDRASTCVVTATHTHAGPCCARGRLGPAGPEIERSIVTAAISTIESAVAGAVPCTLEFGQTHGVGVAHDRRRGHPVDPPVSLLTARDLEGSAVARLVHFPCHPVVMDGANRQISGDYPAYLRADLDKDGATTVFVTGCAGDINTGHSAEASYEPGGPGRTVEEAKRIGGLLADAVRRSQPRRLDVTVIEGDSRAVELDLDVPGTATIAAQAEAWRTEQRDAEPGPRMLLDAWTRWADQQLELHRAGAVTTSWHGRVSVIHLGGLVLVALPGEPFLATGNHIEDILRNADPERTKDVLVLGYADGVPGYLPDQESYPDGGYEVLDAHRYYGMPGPFARGGAERLELAVR
jgi:hypothetical protein